jgi:hypothetical protein
MKAFFSLEEVFRESAIDMHPHTETFRTKSDEPGLAKTAMTTSGLKSLRGDSITPLELGNLITDFHYDSGHFVT